MKGGGSSPAPDFPVFPTRSADYQCIENRKNQKNRKIKKLKIVASISTSPGQDRVARCGLTEDLPSPLRQTPIFHSDESEKSVELPYRAGTPHEYVSTAAEEFRAALKPAPYSPDLAVAEPVRTRSLPFTSVIASAARLLAGRNLVPVAVPEVRGTTEAAVGVTGSIQPSGLSVSIPVPVAPADAPGLPPATGVNQPAMGSMPAMGSESPELGFVDRICRVDNNFYEEMTFSCSLSQESTPAILATAIVDNGAGLGYLLLPAGQALPFKSVPCRSSAVLAQGAAVAVRSAVQLTLTVAGVSREVTLRVMESSVDDQIAVLFGRYLLSLFEITTSGAHLVRLGKQVLYRCDRVRRVTSSYNEDEGEQAIDIEGIVDLPSYTAMPAGEEIVELPFDPKVGEDVDVLLNALVNAGPQPLPHAPATMAFRPLTSSERRDTPDQQFTFELALRDCPPPLGVARLYAGAMIRKLSDAQRLEMGRVIEGYVSAGWWTSLLRPPIDEVAANVFAVPKGENGVRLVCDLRPLNQAYPSTVSDQPRLPFSLATLRLCEGALVVGDCRSAFYRVRLTRPLWLHAGSFGDFACSRLVFGLSLGPEGLEGSLGVLWRLFFIVSPHCRGSLYVDDFWMNVRTGSDSCAFWFRMMMRSGFDVSRNKFQELSRGRELRLFGIKLSFPEGSGESVTDCQRGERLGEALALLRDNRASLSKSDCFMVAGQLAYDPVHAHPREKVCGDLLRSLVGSIEGDWKAPIDQSSHPDRLLLESVLDWALELVETAGSCSHKMRLAAGALSLRLYTDASNAGGAFVLQTSDPTTGDWSDLYEEAWMWRRAEATYHCNRLEAIALFRGLRMVANFIESRKTSCPEEPKPVVSVLTDSKSALAWATVGPSAAVAAGFEARAVQRLAKGMARELHELRRLLGDNGVSIAHVAGVSNSSDELSRLLYRPASNSSTETLVSLLQKRWSRMSKLKRRDAGPTQRDAVRRTQVPSMETEPLVESIARSCFDTEQCVYWFDKLRKALRVWCRRPKDDNLSPLEGMMKSVQGSDPTLAHAPYDQPPFFRNSPEGPLLHRRIGYDGRSQEKVVVPKSAVFLRRLIVRTEHRRSLHRGAEFTSAAVATEVWMDGLRAVTQEVLRGCLRCAVKNARVAWHLPTTTFPRRIDVPVFTRLSMDVLFLDSVRVYSMMCIDTGYLVLMEGKGLAAEDAIAAVRKLQNRFCVRVEYLRLDRGTNFRSSAFRRGMEELSGKCEISFTVPGAPYTNPVERLHREACSIIRSNKFLRLALIEKEAQESLDAIAAIVNRRPIGRYTANGADQMLTPALLAFGAPAFSHSIPAPLHELRDYFYKHLFESLRRTDVKKRERRVSAVVGSRVLYYDPLANSKLDSQFRLAIILDVKAPYIQIRILGEKRELLWVGSASLAPLNWGLPVLSSPWDVSRVGATVALIYDFNNTIQEFCGVVVKDNPDGTLEVKWKDLRWTNEIVDWGACRIICRPHSLCLSTI